MTHLEFWTEYIKELGADPGWVVFENGTLVHPEGADSAEDVLSRLNDNLLGMSGVRSCNGFQKPLMSGGGSSTEK